MGGLTFDTNVPLEVSHLVENLDAIAQAVTYVDQTVVPDNHAVHGTQKYTTNPCVRLCLRALTPPLTEVVAFAIKDYDTLVPVTIGNVNVAVARVDRDLRRFEQRSVARFKPLPVEVPSALSMTPFVPICSNILLPSCVYF